MSNGQGNSGKLIPLLVGLVVGIAVGIAVSKLMDADDGGKRGGPETFLEEKVPAEGQTETVRSTLEYIQQANDASDPAQNPHKDAISAKVNELLSAPAGPGNSNESRTRVHNARKYAEREVWAGVHDELNGIS
jgi:hypothetical protein